MSAKVVICMSKIQVEMKEWRIAWGSRGSLWVIWGSRGNLWVAWGSRGTLWVA